MRCLRSIRAASTVQFGRLTTDRVELRATARIARRDRIPSGTAIKTQNGFAPGRGGRDGRGRRWTAESQRYGRREGQLTGVSWLVSRQVSSARRTIVSAIVRRSRAPRTAYDQFARSSHNNSPGATANEGYAHDVDPSDPVRYVPEGFGPRGGHFYLPEDCATES